jgi:Ca2+/Na+ antiporter
MDESLKAAPSSDDATLSRWLGYGAVAAVLAGLLGAGSAGLSLAGFPQEGFSLSEIIDLAAVFTLVFVLAAYWQVSLKTQAPGLRKSGLGLLGMMIVMELANLNATEGEMRWWNIVIWVVLALVTFVFLIGVWSLEEIEKEIEKEEAEEKSETAAEQKPTPVEPAAKATEAPAQAGQPSAETAEGKATKATGGILVVLVAVGFLVLKLLGKVLGKWAGKQVMKAMNRDLFQGAIGLAMLLLTAVFFAWFAIVKVRLRKALGGLAVCVGVLELAMILLAVLAAGGMFVGMYQAALQAGPDEQALDRAMDATMATWTQRFFTGAIVVNLLWALLTAGLFLNYRRRLAEAAGQPAPQTT